MSGVARAARWGAGTLAGIGVRDLAGALAVVLIVVAALCWVLANEDRSRRLAEILGAWHGDRPRRQPAPGEDTWVTERPGHRGWAIGVAGVPGG